MPDLQEVFRMATQKVRPDPEALERQRRKQRGTLVRERVAVYALVAGLVAAGVIVGISTLRSGDEPAVPASRGAPPAWTNEQLAGVWLQTRGAFAAPQKLLTFTTDGRFAVEANGDEGFGAFDGTYEVEGDTITFTDGDRECPQMKWTGVGPKGPVAVLEFTIADGGAGGCAAPAGFDVEGTRLEFLRISPRSSETDSWEMEREFRSSRQAQRAASLGRVAGIWFQDDGEHVLRISPSGGYTIGVGEAFVTDPADTGTISIDDEGTIEFTSGPESRTCPEGTVMIWRTVLVNGAGMFAYDEVEGDPCASLPIGPISWHNLIRY